MTVKFQAGNPRNNLCAIKLAMALPVERRVSGKWVVVCNDACWETQ